MLSCPYPPDDYSEHHRVGSASCRPDYYVQPKIRPSAAKIHEMHKGSIGLMFGLDKHQIATGFKTQTNKNHMAMNVQKMREMQRRAKEATANKEEVVPISARPVTTNAKYNNIESKVKKHMETMTSEGSKNTNFLKAHTRPCSAPVKKGESEPNLNIDLTDKKPNFVQMNATYVSKLNKTAPKAYQEIMSKREEEAKKEQAIQQRKGKVPKYLAQRKEQWQKDYELEIASQPDPEMPPGHRKMSEAERLQTLKDLEASRKSLLAELTRMPIAMKSQKAESRKREVESKLASVEEALLIFSRPKVFVKIDQ